MKFQLIYKAKTSSPSTVFAECSASVRVAILHGKTGQPAGVSAMTWCCWHTFDPRSHSRTALMAVRG
jgi:hypothetical protein